MIVNYRIDRPQRYESFRFDAIKFSNENQQYDDNEWNTAKISLYARLTIRKIIFIFEVTKEKLGKSQIPIALGKILYIIKKQHAIQ